MDNRYIIWTSLTCYVNYLDKLTCYVNLLCEVNVQSSWWFRFEKNKHMEFELQKINTVA